MERGDKPSVLSVTSRANDKLKLAQHLFSAFMWSFANHLPFNAFSRDVSVNPGPEFEICDHETWTSVEIVSPKLKRILQMIHLTELGIEQEILSIILPPLIDRNILTGQFVVDLVVRECNKTQARSDYQTCFSVYPELLELLTPGARETLICKVLAVCIELLSTSWPVHGLGLFPKFQYEQFLRVLKAILSIDSSNKGIQRLSCTDDRKKYFLTSCLNKIRRLYFGQGRQKDFNNAIMTLEAGTVVDFAQGVDTWSLNKISSDSILELEDCRLFGMNQSQDSFSHRSDDEARDILGWTPRHYAASLDSRQFAPVERDYSLLDVSNRNPYHYLTSVDYFTARFIDKQAGSRAMADRDGIPWLHMVLVHGHITLPEDTQLAFEWLRKQQLDRYPLIDQADNFGRTCTHLAIQMVHKEFVLEVLFKYRNVDPNTKDKEDRSLLMYACSSAIAVSSMLDIVSSLLERGADVDASDAHSRTALYHVVSIEPDSEVDSTKSSVELDQSSTEGSSKTLPWKNESRFSNALKVAEILLKNGAKVESRDKKRSPLAKAKRKRDKRGGNSHSMVGLLEENLEHAKEKEERNKITRYYKPLRLPHTTSSSSLSSYTS